MKYMYPGCFDPITNGHIDIIRRAANLADVLVVLVMDNRDKKAAYSLDERVKMVKIATKNIDNVVVDLSILRIPFLLSRWCHQTYTICNYCHPILYGNS